MPNRKVPCIIVEGADRAGKSTIVEALSREFLRRYGKSPRTAHCDKDSCDWQNPDEVVRFISDNDIIDRLYDSEYVYSAIARGAVSLGPSQMANLRVMQEMAGGHTLFVYSRPEEIIRRFESSTGEYVSAQQSVSAQDAYCGLYLSMRPFRFSIMSGEIDVSEIDKRCTELYNQVAKGTVVKHTDIMGAIGQKVAQPDQVEFGFFPPVKKAGQK